MRTLMRLAVLVVLPVLFAAAAETERKEIHACPDGHGGTVYQDDPCLDTPAPPAKTPAPPPARPAPASRPPARALVPASLPPAPPAPRPTAARPAPPPSADPSSADVMRAWQRFLDALRSGDRAAARACLTGAAIAAFGTMADGLPESGLRDLAAAWSRYRAEGRAGPVWSIRVLRPDTRPKWIFLEKTAGEWKISGI